MHHLTGPGMMLAPLAASLPGPAGRIASGGHLAVQTFFLLSGFVLARSYCRVAWNRESLARYVSIRLARIYPTYLLSLVAMSYFIGRYLARPYIGAVEKASWLLGYVFLLQGWQQGGGPGWNTPAWSLSCEVFFYLLLPAVLPLMWRTGRKSMAAIIAVSFIAPVFLAHLGVPYYWKPIHHFADFTMGIAAARIHVWMEARRVNVDTAWLWYLPCILAGAALIAWPRALEGTYLDLNTALRPLNAIALVGLALGGGAVARFLSNRIVEYLGQASYSMYILHIPVLWWYGNAGLKRLHLDWPAAAIVYSGIVIIVSIVSFELVEKPANRWVRVWMERRSAPRKTLRVAA